jgi:hypothetical protein
LQTAVAVAVAWGLLVITLLSAYLARMQRVAALPIVTEHLGIAIVVVAISHYIGIWVNSAFT